MWKNYFTNDWKCGFKTMKYIVQYKMRGFPWLVVSCLTHLFLYMEIVLIKDKHVFTGENISSWTSRKGCWWLQRAELDGQIVSCVDWLFEHWLTLYYIIWREESIQFSIILLFSRVSRMSSQMGSINCFVLLILLKWKLNGFVFGLFDHRPTKYGMLFWFTADSPHLENCSGIDSLCF